MILKRLSTAIREQNWSAVFLEFIIVFMSVYLAFLFTEYQNDRERARHRDRAIEIVDYGLNQYDQLFAGNIQYHQNHNATFEAALKSGTVPDFSAVTFPAPRYSPDAITQLLSREGFDVFDFDIYLPMTQYVNALQQLGYVEEKLVTLSERYEPLPSENAADHARVKREQITLAKTYLRYLKIRANIMERLLGLSKQIRKGLDGTKSGPDES